MKSVTTRTTLPLIALLCAGTTLATAEERIPNAASPHPSPADAEANYTQAIEARTRDILAVLGLTNSTASARVHDVIMTQYRSLRSWHDANDAALKQALKADTNAAARIRASLKTLHGDFLSKLAVDLTPEQVDQVKDKMTYNKVKVTYDAYCEIIPGLSEAEKAKMLDWLKEAREEAMDCGSAEEKSAVFNRYKGKINNYLTAQGHNVSQAHKDWAQKQRQKAPTPAAPRN